MSIPYIPCVDVSALETYIVATQEYLKRMENIQDIPETENYLVSGLGLPQYTASETCSHPERVFAHLSKMREDLLLFKELYDKVESHRIHQHKKRIQLEKELEEAEAQALVATNVLEEAKALVATNVLEEAKARLMAKRAELETLDDEN
jgi:hypothetical protein